MNLFIFLEGVSQVIMSMREFQIHAFEILEYTVLNKLLYSYEVVYTIIYFLFSLPSK